MAKRLLYVAALFLTIFFFPWWVVMVVGMAGVIVFGNFYEFIFAGVFIDVMYSPIVKGRVTFFASGIFMAAFLFVYWIRTKIRS